MDERRSELHELGQRLRIARSSCDMERAEAAEKAHIAENTLKRYERGKMQPMTMVVGRLAAIYGVSVDWLLGMSGDMRP